MNCETMFGKIVTSKYGELTLNEFPYKQSEKYDNASARDNAGNCYTVVFRKVYSNGFKATGIEKIDKCAGCYYCD